MNENLAEPRLPALAAVDDRAPLGLLVRQALKGSVRRVADLRGCPVGVHSNSRSTTTNAQQLLTLLLRHSGLAAQDVRVLAAGEPFGVRLEQEGLAFALVRLGLPGEGFLRGTLVTSPALLAREPQLAEHMVRVVQRTLAWRRAHSAEEVTAALGLAGVAAAALGAMLRQYAHQFGADGRFSDAQIAETGVFFRESGGGSPAERSYRAASMLVDRWADRRR